MRSIINFSSELSSLNQALEFSNFRLTKKDQDVVLWLSKNNEFGSRLDDEAKLFDSLVTISDERFVYLREVLELSSEEKKKVEELAGEYLINGELPKALLSGKDLIVKGVKHGDKMGELLKEAYQIQVIQKIKKPEVLLQAFLFKT